jgi:hypothetical protein
VLYQGKDGQKWQHAGRFKHLKEDLRGENRELLPTEAILASILQYLMPFLACLVLYSFASATLLKACGMQTHPTFLRAAQGRKGTPWDQVHFKRARFLPHYCSN